VLVYDCYVVQAFWQGLCDLFFSFLFYFYAFLLSFVAGEIDYNKFQNKEMALC